MTDQTSFLGKPTPTRREVFRVPYRGRAPHNKTETSEAAAVEIEPQRGTLQFEVWRFVARCGDHGATRPEIASGTGISENTVRPRVSELLALGPLVETDGVRKTASGRNAKVLKARTR